MSNQLPYNLLWRAIEHGILPACESRGMAVLAYSPLQQGLLSGKYTSPTQLEPGRCGRTPPFNFDDGVCFGLSRMMFITTSRLDFAQTHSGQQQEETNNYCLC